MMKRHLKLSATVLSLMGVGYFCWKIFSNPVVIPESLLESLKTEGQPTPSENEYPQIIVGDSTLTPNDFKWEYDLHVRVPKFEDSEDGFGLPKPDNTLASTPIEDPKGPELKERIVTTVIERKILYRYILEKSKNFDVNDPARFTKCIEQVNETVAASPEFFAPSGSRERLKTKLCEQAIIEQYLEEFVFRNIVILPQDIASYYRTHEKSFKRPQTVLLRQIVVAKEELAQQIRKEIKPHNFAGLAKQYSITPENENGGLIGPFSKEQLPTLFAVVFSMGIGEISGVIKSEFGYHILMPIERRPPQTLSLADATPSIKAELLRTKKLDAYQRWLSAAMNAISVNSPSTGITQ